MIIQSFCCGPFDTNAYIIGCPESKEVAFIDPAPGSHKLLRDYVTKNGLTPTKILLTHTHLDHIADVAALKKDFPVPVYVHADDAQNLITPGSDGLPNWFFIEGVQPDVLYKEGDEVTVGPYTFRVIHTPGHSPGGICLYDAKEGVLISGDTLFHQSIGTFGVPTAQPERMWPSLDKLAKLPPQTQVYPGHGPSTTIGAEDWLPKARQIFG
ncbi:MAG: MBL fold metallo-hydrolase [Chlamydiales bacterium]|nr:MBL fold metallo-hydrolase [Chlamydiales bacterium]